MLLSAAATPSGDATSPASTYEAVDQSNPPFPSLELITAETGCCGAGAGCRGACFGRGLHRPTPTSGYGVEEGVAVIGAEAPLLLVPSVKVRAPVLEVSEDLSRELDGRALGGLPWDGAGSGELQKRGREAAFPEHCVSTGLGISSGAPNIPCPTVWFPAPSIWWWQRTLSTSKKHAPAFPWLQSGRQQVQPSLPWRTWNPSHMLYCVFLPSCKGMGPIPTVTLT